MRKKGINFAQSERKYNTEKWKKRPQESRTHRFEKMELCLQKQRTVHL